MDVRMPDGTIVSNVPDGITQSELLSRYSKFSSAQEAAPLTAESYKAAVAKRNAESPDRSFGDVAKDAGITALKSTIGLPESFVGLADIPTGGRVGKLLEEIGYKPRESREILDTYLSEAQQAANRKVREAEGFLPTIGAALQNPSTIATGVGESLAQMLGGAGVARGLMSAAPKLSAMGAGAIGEGLLGAGSAAEQTRGETADKLLTAKQSLAALGSGLGTAAFGAAGARLANKFGLDDIDTLLASGKSQGAAKSVGDFAKRAIGSGVSEGVFEELPQSAQEKMWSNYATDKPLMEGVAEAAGMGAVTGFAMGVGGGGAGSLMGRTGKTDQPVTAQAEKEQPVAPVVPPIPAPATVATPAIKPIAQAPQDVNAPSQDREAMLKELEDQLAELDQENPPQQFEVKPVAESQQPAAPVVEPVVEAPAEAPVEKPAAPDTSLDAQKYDTPDLRLKQSDVFGTDTTTALYTEMESHGRAALKNRSLTDGYAKKKDAIVDAADAATIAFGTGDYSVFQPYAQTFPKVAKQLSTHLAAAPKAEPAATDKTEMTPQERLRRANVSMFNAQQKFSNGQITQAQYDDLKRQYADIKLRASDIAQKAAQPIVPAVEPKGDYKEVKSLETFFAKYKEDKKRLDDLPKYGQPEVKQTVADLNQAIQKVTDAINAKGYSADAIKHKAPSELRPLFDQFSTLTGGGSRLLMESERVGNNKKLANPEKLAKAVRESQDDVSNAYKLLGVEPEVAQPVAQAAPAATPARKVAKETPLRRAAYAKNPLMTFLASNGLYHVKGKPNSQMSEFNAGKQIMVSGFGPVFKSSGKQLDELLQLAIEDGYLPPDATEDQLYNLIVKAVAGNKVEPLYSEQGVENTAAKYEERMAQEEQAFEERAGQTDAEWHGMSEADYVDMMAREIATVSDAEFAELDQAVAELDKTPAGNMSVRAAMEAMGFTEQEIQDEENRTAPKVDEAVATEPPQSDETSQAAPAFELEAQTTEELKTKQAEVDRLNKENERLSKAADAKEKADAARDDFVLTGSDRPADVAASQGQKDIFGAAEEAPAAPEDRFKKYTRQTTPTTPKIERETNPSGKTTDGVEWKVTGPTGDVNRFTKKKDAQELFDSYATEAKPAKGTVATPDGAVLRYPVALDMVKNGYEVLALDNPRTYIDKGGTPHRTFEKGPLRIAMTPQRVLFQNRNAVNVGFGNEDDMALEAILVDPKSRNQGLATQVMQDITKAADKNGITLYLEPTPLVNVKKNEVGLDRDQLETFYNKFGFELSPDSDRVMQRAPNEVADEVVGPAEKPAAPRLTREPVTIEGQFTEVGEEKQRALITDQTKKLTDTQVGSLEKFYGFARDTEEFANAVRQDVVNFITKGAEYVNGKIRAIIRSMANGVMSVAVAFNPQFVSQPYTIAVPQYETRIEQVMQEVPASVQKLMSDDAKRAYATIYPAIKGELQSNDKFFIVADKQTANTFVFNPDGSPFMQSKTLFGVGIGDFVKGDNNIASNRITPAGLFDLGLRDAKRSVDEAATAGEYDFGKVFVLDKSQKGANGPYSTTIMHSVWTKETDAKQRLAALQKPGAADSRYSFGCINVDKETYGKLVTNNLAQMDGAKIFIVPENGTDVMSFVNGEATYSTDIIRQRAEPVTKKTKVEVQRAAETAAADRTVAAKEEEGPMYNSIEATSIDVDGVQRPTKNSEGRQIAGNEKAIRNFWRWFGDSKVVDEDGRPRVMYHSTDASFDEFDTTRRATAGEGSFFGSTPGFSTSRLDGGNVIPVYLSLKNPKIIDTRKNSDDIFKAKFIKEGYDGVMLDMDGRIYTVVAFEPNQIKSAIGNRGTFDESGIIVNDIFPRVVIADEKKRSPSFKRRMDKLNRDRLSGKITDEAFINEADWALKSAQNERLSKDIPERVRGADYIRQKLLEAKRKGDISTEAVDLAEWFIRSNEQLVEDLGVSVRSSKADGVGGQYSTLNRIMYLVKQGGSDLTVVHEILHHLERMMPPKVQQAIRTAWSKQLANAQKKAKTPAEKVYFKALMNAHYGNDNLDYIDVPNGPESEVYMKALSNMHYGAPGSKSSMTMAETLLKMGLVPIKNYRFFNPSEFWAVNGSEIVQGRFDAVQGGVLARLKNWLKELGQKIKSLFGFDSTAPIIRALDSLSKADGQFVTEDMLGRGDYKNVSGQTNYQNYKGGDLPPAQWDSPADSKMDSFQYKLVDKQIDTKRVIERIKDAVGEISEKFNAYIKEELYHGRTAKATKDFLQKELLPLVKDMKDANVTIDEFDEYLHNRHAPEYNEHINKVNPNKEALKNRGSGISNDEAKAYMNGLSKEQKATFEKLATQLDSIVNNTQEILIAGGIETKETIAAWRQQFPFYVPLKRDNLDYVNQGTGIGAGYATKGGTSKRATGSLKNVIDIFENIALQREQAIMKSEKARVGRALYGLAIQNPNAKFWLPINPDAIKNKDKLTEELEDLGLSAADAANIAKEPASATFNKKTGLVEYQVNPLLRNSDNVFPIRINGKDRFIIFNGSDPRAQRMVQSLKNLDAEQMGLALGTIGEVTRFMASVNTQYNPVFGAWNFVRDVQGAALNLSTTDIAGSEGKVLKGVWPALASIYSDLRAQRSGKEAEGEWQKLFERFQKAGGTTGYKDQFSRGNDKAGIVARELQKLDRGNVRQAADAVFNWLSDYNDAMENAVRLSAFKVALDKGLSEDKAASLAKNLTVNFNRKGASSPTLQSLYAFFNASVQGTKRLAETLQGPAGKKIIAGGFAIGAAQAIALAMAGYDDDEPPKFLKDKNLIIPIFGGDYLIIPMPMGFNIFPGIGRLTTEYILGQAGMITGAKSLGDKALDVTSLVLDSFNPLGSGSLLQIVSPTAFDPLAAIQSNKDAFGRPISKEDRATSPTPGFQRSREGASWFSKNLAELLNYVSSPTGTKYTKGAISPTADQIDYLIGQYTGGVGRELMKTGEYAKATVKGETEDLPSYRVPIAGKLYGETTTPAAISTKFYLNVTELAKHENELKQRQKNKDDTREYRAEHPEVRFINRANYIENQITALNKQKKALQEKDAPEAQIKKIDDQKTVLMKGLNDQLRKLQQ